jgi:UDP-N-acetyl-D-galactosamine dehydrogenase
MYAYVSKQVILALAKTGKTLNKSRVLVMGVTFKENVPDTRNSKVLQIIQELRKYGIEVHACDPYVEHEKILSRFSATPASWPLDGILYDAVVIAVPHKEFKALPASRIKKMLNHPGAVVDLKWVYKKEDFQPDVVYEGL